jgi:hypothetical protein
MMTDLTQVNDEEAAAMRSAAVVGIEECFHEVVWKHGRDMFLLVLNAGMAQEAVKKLAERAGQSRELRHAVQVVAGAFNTLSNELAVTKGWTGEMLAQCERDTQLAFSHKIVVPGAEQSRIILGGH